MKVLMVNGSSKPNGCTGNSFAGDRKGVERRRNRQ